MSVFDAWTFEGRSRVYETLLEATWLPWPEQSVSGSPPPLLLSDQSSWDAHRGNLAWGLALQFVWQFESGRYYRYVAVPLNERVLASPSTLVHRIPPCSWWGSMNILHSVTPWRCARAVFTERLGAHTVDDQTQPRRMGHPHPERYPADIDGPFCHASFALVVRHWLDYCRLVRRLQQLPVADFQRDADAHRQQLSALLWHGHTSGLRYGLAVFEPELRLLSRIDQEFSVGFCLLVIDLEAHYLQTTHPAGILHLQRKLLPQRLLTPFDHAAFDHDNTITDLSPTTLAFLKAMRQQGQPQLQQLYGVTVDDEHDASVTAAVRRFAATARL